MGDGETPSASIWTLSPISCNINSYSTRGSIVVGAQNVHERMKKVEIHFRVMLIYYAGWGNQIKQLRNVSDVKTEICSCQFSGCGVGHFPPFHTQTYLHLSAAKHVSITIESPQVQLTKKNVAVYNATCWRVCCAPPHCPQSAMTQTHLELSPGLVAPRGPCSMLFPWIMSESLAVCHGSASLWRESCWGAYAGCDAWLHWQTYPQPCMFANGDPPPPPYVQLCTQSQKHRKGIK